MAILKKIFFLSLFLFFLSGMLWGVYVLSFKKATKDATTLEKKSEAETKSGEITETKNVPEEKKLAVITKEAILSPSLSSSGNGLVYFKKTSGQAFEGDFFGTGEKNISVKNNPNLENVFWSADKSKAILKIKKSEGVYSFIYHDFSTNTDKAIKENVDEVSWQKNANRIFYKYFDSVTKERTLNVSDPDGTNWKKLADIPYRKVSIAQIPKTGVVSFWNSADAGETTLLQTVPLAEGEAKTIFQDKFGADYLWDNSGKIALVSTSNEKNGGHIQLGVINSNGGEYRNLDIPTFASKCVWSQDGKTVYYALPGGIPENSVLPNDYESGKFQTTDTFWKVDIEKNEKSRVIETADIFLKVDAADMFLDSGENILFFRNKVDGKLYRIIL